MVDCDHVLFAYIERHTQEAVRQLFGAFKGFLQSDASSVYEIFERRPPKDDHTDDTIKLVGVLGALPSLFRDRRLQISSLRAGSIAYLRRKLARDEHVRRSSRLLRMGETGSTR